MEPARPRAGIQAGDVAPAPQMCQVIFRGVCENTHDSGTASGSLKLGPYRLRRRSPPRDMRVRVCVRVRRRRSFAVVRLQCLAVRQQAPTGNPPGILCRTRTRQSPYAVRDAADWQQLSPDVVRKAGRVGRQMKSGQNRPRRRPRARSVLLNKGRISGIKDDEYEEERSPWRASGDNPGRSESSNGAHGKLGNSPPELRLRSCHRWRQ